jgi:hypothetical protein
VTAQVLQSGSEAGSLLREDLRRRVRILPDAALKRSSPRSVGSSVRVLAQRDDGALACFVVTNPPTAQDTERIALLAALPGLSSATWTTEPGTSSR